MIVHVCFIPGNAREKQIGLNKLCEKFMPVNIFHMFFLLNQSKFVFGVLSIDVGTYAFGLTAIFYFIFLFSRSVNNCSDTKMLQFCKQKCFLKVDDRHRGTCLLKSFLLTPWFFLTCSLSYFFCYQQLGVVHQ